ncbi:MAG: cupin domain-containing protein [Defluviitaleaceae bacterium]|nr:cupin domain-containing protein [Defluviitaleaceae bacterium]
MDITVKKATDAEKAEMYRQWCTTRFSQFFYHFLLQQFLRNPRKNHYHKTLACPRTALKNCFNKRLCTVAYTLPTWGCEVSEFDWYYDNEETCLLVEGEVEVLYEGRSVSFGIGDLVTFPKGLNCVWKVTKPVRKHYIFR